MPEAGITESSECWRNRGTASDLEMANHWERSMENVVVADDWLSGWGLVRRIPFPVPFAIRVCCNNKKIGRIIVIKTDSLRERPKLVLSQHSVPYSVLHLGNVTPYIS